ncbi:hypothetical protein FCV25MIE_04262 [Fagus crenata]
MATPRRRYPQICTARAPPKPEPRPTPLATPRRREPPQPAAKPCHARSLPVWRLFPLRIRSRRRWGLRWVTIGGGLLCEETTGVGSVLFEIFRYEFLGLELPDRVPISAWGCWNFGDLPPGVAVPTGMSFAN